ncbi:MAG: hypothetical protein WEE64_10945 [Dehalococcoidia bacterium]
MRTVVAWTIIAALLIACNGSGGDADPTATAAGTAAPTASAASIDALAKQLNGDRNLAQVVWAFEAERPTWACIGESADTVDGERYPAPREGFRAALGLPDGEWEIRSLLPSSFLIIDPSAPPLAAPAFERRDITFDGDDYPCVAPSSSS